MRRPILMVLVSITVLSSCGAPGEALSPLPTHETAEGGPSETALLVGTMQAEHTDGSVCVWVVADSGQRNAVVWPRGFEARLVDGEVALVDDGGDIRAVEGDRVELGGGFRDDSPAVDKCGGDGPEIFYAGMVERAAE